MVLLCSASPIWLACSDGAGSEASSVSLTPSVDSTQQGGGLVSAAEKKSPEAGEAERGEAAEPVSPRGGADQRAAETSSSEAQAALRAGEAEAELQVSKLESSTKEPAQPKKPSKCRRGIHKGRKQCKVKRFHINVRHINRGIVHKELRLIGEQRNITKEGRKVMLELLSDWRTKERCSYGYTFNYEYSGRASWRMYDCYVQDRLLWYLYLVGHHFDSEIQIVSGLRSEERKSSRHHNGHAVDFRVAGVKAKEVWDYCKKTFPLAGIGYYPSTGFVHLDVGRDSHQAYWVDSSGSGESAQYKSGVSQVQRGRAQKSQAGMIRSIKGMLSRHYKKFKKQRADWLKRQAARKKRAERRRKRRKAKKGRK